MKKKKRYEIRINAPVDKVYRTLINKPDYEKWTAPFNPTSSFEGSWNKGDKIYFTGEEEGKKAGMIARIAENIPNKFISIEHYGMLDGDKEITEGPEIESWAGSHEDYHFSEENGNTVLGVELEIAEQWESHFDQAWPQALGKLKELAEA